MKTRSEFLKRVEALKERIDALDPDDSIVTTQAEARDIASAIQELADQQREKFDNTPEGLQQGPTGQLLEARAENCEDWSAALENEADDAPDMSEWIDRMRSAEYLGE